MIARCTPKQRILPRPPRPPRATPQSPRAHLNPQTPNQCCSSLTKLPRLPRWAYLAEPREISLLTTLYPVLTRRYRPRSPPSLAQIVPKIARSEERRVGNGERT